ncbi:uncharacterized protein LOC132902318 [Amyelois transitella]|uniref:uncharacterized protein LOC132902318 n=1 Tax=Amyelois transitella TaxID=680683 RepID=UPI00298F9001|nr:uncharacterized protein LOC132902318 [Amyelois transitella]
MIVTLAVVLFVYFAVVHGQGMSTESPAHAPALPFLDLFTGASTYYGEPVRKVFENDYPVSCAKPDTLTSFANILGSAAKIMISAAVIVFLKFLVGKLMLFPLVFVLIGKIGLKAFLLWPWISKMMKYFKKKKKKHFHGRMMTGCVERIACVIARSSSAWTSNLGAAATFTLIDDIDENSALAKNMLRLFAGEHVAECLSFNCNADSTNNNKTWNM